jgi:hypothetical protein
VVTIHAYEGTADGMKTSVNGKWATAMSSTNCVKPLWVTEMGIDSYVVGETTQANEYAKAASYILNGSAHANALFYYRLEDHGGTSTISYGITRPAPTYVEKPSYTSLQTTIPQLCVTTYP